MHQKLKLTESSEKFIQPTQKDDLSRPARFEDDPKTFLHGRHSGDDKKLTDGNDVTDKDDGDDDDHPEEDSQTKPLPRLAPKVEVVRILGEVISSESEG